MQAEETSGLITCQVAGLKKLNHDIMQVLLEPVAPAFLSFHAGQYINLILDDATERPFSLASAPREDNLIELHIRHNAGGGVARWLNADNGSDLSVVISGPRGEFRLHDSDRPMIMLAGGTGFAPIKGLMEQIVREGVTRPVYLYWGARRREDLYMDELPRQWARDYANIHFTPVLSEDTGEHDTRSGLVHEAVLEDFPDLAGFEAYLSGPAAMIQAARESFLEHGLDEQAMFSDMFAFIDD
ncbi:MAG: NAD(P)H-flavin reductase [Gammaproteobacteria bacterium]